MISYSVVFYPLFCQLQFVVHEAPGQELEVDVFDEDTDKDDILGK